MQHVANGVRIADDRPVFRLQQSENEIEQRGFSTTARTYNDEKFFLAYREIDIFEGRDLAVHRMVGVVDFVEF